jgi:hypothetical protein
MHTDNRHTCSRELSPIIHIHNSHGIFIVVLIIRRYLTGILRDICVEVRLALDQECSHFVAMPYQLRSLRLSRHFRFHFHFRTNKSTSSELLGFWTSSIVRYSRN